MTIEPVYDFIHGSGNSGVTIAIQHLIYLDSRDTPVRKAFNSTFSSFTHQASSYSSMTDSTVSLNIVTVTLKMDTVNYLGISIVGQSNRAGDGGIYVGSIMRGGAVALDGRIEPGDMLLEVNGISFEDMSNDDAVRVLREQVQKPGYGCFPTFPTDYQKRSAYVFYFYCVILVVILGYFTSNCLMHLLSLKIIPYFVFFLQLPVFNICRPVPPPLA